MPAEFPKQDTAQAATQERTPAAEYSQVEQQIQAKRSELTSAPTEQLTSLVAEIQGLESKKNEMFDTAHIEASEENQRRDQENSEAEERARSEAQAAETAASAEREAASAQHLHGVQERLGISSTETQADPLAGFTPEEYKKRLELLDVSTPEFEAESDRIRNALYDKVIDGTITPEQKQALADYMIDHYVVQGGNVIAGSSSSFFGPRWKELEDSTAYADVLELAKEQSKGVRNLAA